MNWLVCSVLVAVSFSGWAQQRKEILFQFRDSPSQTHFHETKEIIYQQIRWHGAEDKLQRLKDNNAPLLTTDTVVTTHRLKVTSGNADSMSSFFLTMEYVASSTTSKKVRWPQGTVIFGHVDSNRPTHIDSVNGPGLSDADEKKLINSFQRSIDELYFPARRMGVGDTLVTHSLVSIPFFDKSWNMDISSTYELMSIGPKTADLSITILFTLIDSNLPYEIKVTGGGKGKVVYDIANSVGIYRENNLRMVVEVKFLPDLNFEMIQTSSYVSQVTGK
ncbi:MAG: hypothetical protein JNL40_02040 [Cyclobacteriaceae bacterium]|nr:hypothetical protein [Cyclobacteriaceae bacterium]